MSNINEKLSAFEKTIMEDAKKEADEILAEFEANKNKLVHDMTRTAKKEADETIKAEKEKLEREENEQLSEASAAGKRELLNLRREIVDKVFAEIKKKIADFRKSDKYYEYLKNAVISGIDSVGEGEKIIFIDKNDSAYKEKLESEFKTAVKIENADFLGGARVSNTDRNIVCDNTVFDRLLEERDAFLEIADLSIEV